ncbi:hypothetical protein KVM77_00965 [Helicobacter pylori]|nr:hypothetical protein KVM77_00965 [Helicobacter pylori]
MKKTKSLKTSLKKHRLSVAWLLKTPQKHRLALHFVKSPTIGATHIAHDKTKR